MNKPRLLVLSQFLSGGGAVQVFLRVLQNLDPTLFDIHFGILSEERPATGPLPAYLTLHRLRIPRARHAAFALVRLIRSVQPDLIVCANSHICQLLLIVRPLLPAKTRIVGRLETTASQLPRTRLRNFLYSTVYRSADAILCQSESMADDLIRHFGHIRERIHVLPNPIDLAPAPAGSPCPWPPGPGPRLLAIGRLSPEKGFLTLLEAVAPLRDRWPHLQLSLLGIGPEESDLRARIRELGLSQSVSLPGQIRNPVEYCRDATLFVLSSTREGMPNAMLEAAAAGLPLVLPDTFPALNSLLAHAPGVWFAQQNPVTPTPSLSAALASALQTLHRPGSRPARFQHTFLAPFGLENSIPAWQQCLLHLATGDLP